MIKSVEMFTVICDRCGVDACDGSDYAAWSPQEVVRDITSDGDWRVIDDKDYCPACVELDEETDEWIVKHDS